MLRATTATLFVVMGAAVFSWAALYGTASAQTLTGPGNGTIIINKTFPGFEGRRQSGERTNVLRSPQISIRYGTRVLNEVGAIVPSGSTVPAGTKLRFVFKDQQATDIGWFLIGGTFDSPYGKWARGIPAPSRPNLCAQGVLTGQRKGFRETGQYYVDPPQMTLSGIPGATCTNTAGGGRVCEVTLTQAGTFNASFNFAATQSAFYTTYWNANQQTRQCSNYPDVGPQIVVWGAPGGTNNPPWMLGASPLAATQGGLNTFQGGSGTTNWESGGGGGGRGRGGGSSAPASSFSRIAVPAVTVPFTITVEADPQGGAPSDPNLAAGGSQCIVGQPYTFTMRSVDPDGDTVRYGIDWDGDGQVDQFVPPSGYVASGATQQVTRTFATAGQKTVRVRATDSNGLSSGWATHSFNCAAAPANNTGNNADGAGGSGDGGFGGADGSGFDSGTDGRGFPGSGTPSVSIRAVPSLVASGQTTKIHWSSTRAVSCTVTGNGDSWTGLVSPVNGRTTSAITSQQVYTLRCIGEDGVTRTDEASVWVAPVWTET